MARKKQKARVPTTSEFLAGLSRVKAQEVKQNRRMTDEAAARAVTFMNDTDTVMGAAIEAVADEKSLSSSTASILFSPASSENGSAQQNNGQNDDRSDSVSRLITSSLQTGKNEGEDLPIVEQAKAFQTPKQGPTEYRTFISEEQPRFGMSGPICAETASQKFIRAEKIKAAAYIRVSTDSKDQENSYEAQEKYFSRLLDEHPDWENVGVYSDYGLSGTEMEHRTGLNRLIRHCGQGRVDRILCKSISRFSRNTQEFLETLRKLKELGVTVVFQKEGLDTATPVSEFILTTLAAISQEESRSISTNIRWGLDKRQPKGEVPNVDIYGYRFAEGDDAWEAMPSGYKLRKLIVVEDEAQIVRRIFDMFLEGKRQTEIARILNRENVPPPKTLTFKTLKRRSVKEGIDQGWKASRIGSILASERYCGDVLTRKTYTPDYLTHKSYVNRGEVNQFYVRDHHPAIIDRETYEAAKRLRQRRKVSKKAREPHAFSGRLICPHCGRFYCVGNLQEHPIWYCPSSKNTAKHICDAEAVYEQQVVGMFRRAILERFKLTVEPLKCDDETLKLLSGYFPDSAFSANSAFFTDESREFVKQMIGRLESVQEYDHVESDRHLRKKIITALEQEIAVEAKRKQRAEDELEALQIRSEVLGTPVDENRVRLLRENIRSETELMERAAEDKRQKEAELDAMEQVWEQQEFDYEEREKAIAWMKTLPAGHEGTIQFLNGLSDQYVRAFAMFITIHDPLHYTIRWFDNTETHVEMFSNFEGWQYTSDYWDGTCWRRKPKNSRGRRKRKSCR